jgi:hypothetical protein
MTEGLLPKELRFGPPTPSPAVNSVRFELALPAAANVEVRIYDVAGREVTRLLSRHMAAGNFVARWGAAEAPSGVYFARLLIDGRSRGQHRIVLVK